MMDSETRAAFLKRLRKMIECNDQSIEPMEAGRMRLGQSKAGGQWEDITQNEIANLKRINADLRALAEKIEAREL